VTPIPVDSVARTCRLLLRQTAAFLPLQRLGSPLPSCRMLPDGNETRLAKFGVADAQHGANEVDVCDGQPEHFARPQSGEVQEYQGSAQYGIADRGPRPPHQILACGQESTASSRDIIRATRLIQPYEALRRDALTASGTSIATKRSAENT
jgi:hypothetical protein